jgi:hypothetical protein
MGEIGQFEIGESKGPVERCYYEATSGGGRFWFDINGRYHQRNERQMMRQLKSEGLQATIPKGSEAEMSQVDAALLEITNQREVDFAGPYSGWHAGEHWISGKKVLITESPRLIAPASPEDNAARLDSELPWGGDCAGWPNLGQFLDRGFRGVYGTEEIDQLPYHLAWLKRGYLALEEGQPNQGHALIMAGDPGCGKSLHIAIITELLGGRLCRPLRYIFGESNFNAEMFTSSHLVVDDEGSKTHIGDRMIVKARTKQCVAVSGASCEGKNKDSFEIETFMRLTFACNLEEENLLVLPPLDDDLIGKVHCFKFHAGAWPWDEHATKKVVWDLLSQELPAFLWWLLNKFELPEALQEEHLRFGVKPYAHPEIVQGIDFLSPEARLWGYIERTVLRSSNHYNDIMLGAGEWKGSAVDLEAALKDEDSGLDYKERGKVPQANPNLGKMLKKLSERPAYAGRIVQGRESGGKKRYWRLLSQEAFDNEKQPEQQEERYDPND